MTSYTMSIDGEQHTAAQSYGVINPATEEEFARAPSCSREQLEAAISAAQRAFATWKRDETARRSALRKGAELLQAKAADIGRTLTLEQGKPLAQATGEVLGAAAQLKAIAEMPLPHEVTRDNEKGRVEIYYRPYGVMAAITPWNFPVMLASWKIAPALLGRQHDGAQAVAVHAALHAAARRGAERERPAGRRAQRDQRRQRHRRAAHRASARAQDLVHRDRSRPVRRSRSAAPDLKRVTLELGGNDPAIVLDDADPATIATQLFWSAFMNCGQVCMAVKRIYVPEALLAPLASAIAKVAREVKVGDGIDPQTQLGPINNAMQLERVSGLVADAKQRGAQVHAGGERMARKGYFFAPTVLTGVGDEAPIVAEEQFGPVLPLLPYRSLDDAIERANATHFGLGASVWSPNRERALEAAKQIDAGTVWINQHLALTADAPFGGAKWSGIGAAGGRWAIESFLQQHVINQRFG